MDYSSVVIEGFWQVMTSFASLVVPCICILLIFSVIRSLLFNDR